VAEAGAADATSRWGRLMGAGEAGSAAAGLAFALSGYVVSSTDNMQYLSTAAAEAVAVVAWTVVGRRRRLHGVARAGTSCM